MFHCAALLLSVAWSVIGGAARAEQAGTGVNWPPVPVDWHTGIALHGVDPVAYFSVGDVVEGRGAWELRYAGALWRFASEGNRAAFEANPNVYMPGFGGNDPVTLARGVMLPGNPRVWVRFEERIYLFHTLEARVAFLAEPQSVLSRALAQAARSAAAN